MDGRITFPLISMAYYTSTSPHFLLRRDRYFNQDEQYALLERMPRFQALYYEIDTDRDPRLNRFIESTLNFFEARFPHRHRMTRHPHIYWNSLGRVRLQNAE